MAEVRVNERGDAGSAPSTRTPGTRRDGGVGPWRPMGCSSLTPKWLLPWGEEVHGEGTG